jgi:hypothetical protein
MSDLKKAAQQALEALEEATNYTGCEAWSPSMTDECLAAAAALRAALAQQEQEPVEPLKGWKLNHARKHPDEEGVAEIGYFDPEDDRFAPILTVDTGLYYQDAQALPLAVAILSMLSAHPPRREWQSLTDDEISALFPSSLRSDYKPYSFARAIEQALKERNT